VRTNLYKIEVQFKHTKNSSEAIKKERNKKEVMENSLSLCSLLGHSEAYCGLQSDIIRMIISQCE
jgi:hypothetical protein